MNLFPFCSGYWYESVAQKITDPMDKIITVRIDSGEKEVEERWRVSSPFTHFRFFFLLPVGITIK